MRSLLKKVAWLKVLAKAMRRNTAGGRKND